MNKPDFVIKPNIQMTRPTVLTILTCLLILSSSSIYAEGDSALKKATANFIPYSGKTIFQSLKRPDVLEIELTLDIEKLFESKKTDEYQEARIEYAASNGSQMVYDVKLRPRGKYRRKVCDFPPIKLKFPKKVLRYQGYAEFNTLKLVTHCMDEKAAGKSNVFREYLAYKMYNELTEKSFQVQLVKITYHDTSGKYGKMKRFGFIIENTDEMASRLSGSVCDCMNVPTDAIVATDENRMAIYQYAIGNSDWSIILNRNLKLVVDKATEQIIPVPYDFDFSGLVDADYAIPNADYGHTSVKDRVFIGMETDDRIRKMNVALFKQKKESMYKVINGFKRLSYEEKLEMQSYLDEFYNSLQDLGRPTAASAQ